MKTTDTDKLKRLVVDVTRIDDRRIARLVATEGHTKATWMHTVVMEFVNNWEAENNIAKIS